MLLLARHNGLQYLLLGVRSYGEGLQPMVKEAVPQLSILLYTACGDAFGAGHETLPGSTLPGRCTLDRYYPHRNAAKSEGRYTDDTQMSIAVAEALVKTNGSPTADDFAEAFIAAFRRDPRAGYSPTTHRLLADAPTLRKFTDQNNSRRDSSGAAMRSGPIGVLGHIERVLAISKLQASTTHRSPAAIAAAQAAALMVHHGLYQLGRTPDLPQFLNACIPGWPWLEPHQGPVSIAAVTCVKAALWALVGSRSVSEMLASAVRLTGDVDTVCAIAMSAASCASDIERTLPSFLIDGLEMGPYGRNYLERLDDELAVLAAAEGAPLF